MCGDAESINSMNTEALLATAEEAKAFLEVERSLAKIEHIVLDTEYRAEVIGEVEKKVCLEAICKVATAPGSNERSDKGDGGEELER